MMYEVSHRTAYRYDAPVTQSQHLLHLAPRKSDRQTVRHHSLLIEPAPTARTDFTDCFGNPASVLGISEEHSELVIHARSTVEIRKREPIDVEQGTPWEQILPLLNERRPRDKSDLAAIDYAMPSPETRTARDVADYAKPSFPEGRPVLAAAWSLTSRIFTDFKFDRTATDVSTPVSKVLADRRGVCQDFAHLALACFRAMGVPARYMSGYLLTRPPPGKVKLQGADASHAWVSVWSPETGWVDFDPTNKVIPDEEHIAFAHGREYRDISPISGVLIGGSSHSVNVAVDVRLTG
jgi:transglutaminase-like putative cysteine protease